MPFTRTLLSRLADALLGPTARAAMITADLGAMIAQGRALPVAALKHEGVGR